MSKYLDIKIILGFAAVYVIWGSTYLAIRIGIEAIPPFLLIGMRFVTGGLLLYGWARMRGAPSPRLSDWTPALVTGLLMPLGGTGLVAWAEMTVPSGLTALLIAMTPMWIVLADWLRPAGTRPNLPVTVGLLLGFSGVALLINPADLSRSGEVDLFGAVLIVIASISWAAGSVYSRQVSRPSSGILRTSLQMLVGGGGLLLISALTGEAAAVDFGAVALRSWLALGYLTLFGSIAYAIYVWLLSVSTPAKVSTYAYVNPVIALALGASLAGEKLSNWTIVCSAIVIVAIVIVISAKARAPRSTDTAPSTAPPQAARCLRA
ncbi:MAG: EamA family transporter [candidate division Zixibacteria bacterium]|nr:EamA family transporter [candidate division Zixibacteria bacterium]